MRFPWRRRHRGRHAVPLAGVAAAAHPAGDQPVERAPLVSLVFGDGSTISLPPEDPRARPFHLVAHELGRTTSA